MLRTVFAALCLAGPLAYAQQPTPKFEVATVRLHPDGDPTQGSWSLPGKGEFKASNLTLEWLIRLAYNVDPKQIVGEPNWLTQNTYDINAKPEAGIALSREELRPRLQALLAERFHLVAHTEMRRQPGYELIVSKRGAKLTPTDGAHFAGWKKNVSPGHLEGSNWSMAELAANLTSLQSRPVVDRTGITGSYDFSVVFAKDTDTDSTLPSLFTALEESTGLRLVPGQVPVQVVIIDSISPTPTEN